MRTRQALRTGRATFYLHYKDKEDLLLEEFRDIARDRVQMLSETPVSIWKSKLDSLGLSDGDTLSMPLFMIFEHAAQNADLYRILLKHEGSLQIRAQLGEIAIQAISEIFEKNESLTNEHGVPVEFVAAYFTGSNSYDQKFPTIVFSRFYGNFGSRKAEIRVIGQVTESALRPQQTIETSLTKH
jgi:hypothetical protein